MLSVNFPLENRRSLRKTETTYHRHKYAHPILYIPKAAANHPLAAYNMPYPNQHTKPTPSNFSTSPPQKPSLTSPASPQSGAAIHPIKSQQFCQPPPIPLKTNHHTYTRSRLPNADPTKVKKKSYSFFLTPPKKNQPQRRKKAYESKTACSPTRSSIRFMRVRSFQPLLHVKLLRTGESGS